MRVVWMVVLSAAAVAAGGLSLAARAAPRAEKASFKVDPVHSMVLFKVRHMGASNFWGRFDAVSGSLVLDEADPSASTLEFEVKVESIDTNNPRRDQHLKSPDFFNAKQFPLIHYKGSSVKKTGEGAYEVSGDLTLHGVTRPLTLKFERVGTGKGPAGPLAGFETTFTIKRSDFGMSFMLQGVSDEVMVITSVECGQA